MAAAMILGYVYVTRRQFCHDITYECNNIAFLAVLRQIVVILLATKGNNIVLFHYQVVQ